MPSFETLSFALVAVVGVRRVGDDDYSITADQPRRGVRLNPLSTALETAFFPAWDAEVNRAIATRAGLWIIITVHRLS